MACLLLLLICKNSLYILDVNPRQVCNLQVFSPFRGLSFHSVDFVPYAQQFLMLPSPNLYTFSFVACHTFFEEKLCPELERARQK